MPISKRQLAASIRTTPQIADREAIAAFILDDATTFAAQNPSWRTSVGAQRQVWTGYQREFRFTNVASLGLACLLKALQTHPTDEAIVQEILQANGVRAYVYHHGDGCRIVGSVVHAKANATLPVIKPLPRARTRQSVLRPTLQLDLFAIDGIQVSLS